MQLLLKLRNLSLHLATFIKVTQPLANHNLDHLLHKLGGVLHTNAEGEAHTQRIKPIVSFSMVTEVNAIDTKYFSKPYWSLSISTFYAFYALLQVNTFVKGTTTMQLRQIISLLNHIKTSCRNSIQTSPTCRRSQFLRDITFLWTFNGVLIEENFEAKNFALEFKDYYQESWSWEISIG